jgi:hypothetical protein
MTFHEDILHNAMQDKPQAERDPQNRSRKDIFSWSYHLQIALSSEAEYHW